MNNSYKTKIVGLSPFLCSEDEYTQDNFVRVWSDRLEIKATDTTGGVVLSYEEFQKINSVVCSFGV